MPAKPRNASFKDSVVAYLTLIAHFAFADNYPKDTNCAQLGKRMLVQLMLLHLRKKLFAKKAKELKDSSVDRAEKKVQEFSIALEKEKEKAGILSYTYVSTKKLVDEA